MGQIQIGKVFDTWWNHVGIARNSGSWHSPRLCVVLRYILHMSSRTSDNDCNLVFIDTDGDEEADEFVQVCDGVVYEPDSFTESTTATVNEPSKGPSERQEFWVNTSLWVILAILFLVGLRFRRRRARQSAKETPYRQSGPTDLTSSHRLSNRQANDLSKAHGAQPVSDDNSALTCSTCGSAHGLRSDWYIESITCECGATIKVKIV